MSEVHKEQTEVEPQEVERKFLVADVPTNLHEFEHHHIRQGYLAIDSGGTEVRLRDQDSSYTLTVKSKGDLVRGEWEAEITEEQFVTWWAATVAKRLEKTRYRVPYGEETIELDVYEGDLAGLVTAEVEFGSIAAAQDFEPAHWLSQDVTADKAFKNQNLATKGLPD